MYTEYVAQNTLEENVNEEEVLTPKRILVVRNYLAFTNVKAVSKRPRLKLSVLH